MNWDNMTWKEIRKNYTHLWILIIASVVLPLKNLLPAFCTHAKLIDFIVAVCCLLFWVYALIINATRGNKMFLKFSFWFWIIALLGGLFLLPPLNSLLVPPFAVFTTLYSLLLRGITYIPTLPSIVYVIAPFLFLGFTIKYLRKN